MVSDAFTYFYTFIIINLLLTSSEACFKEFTWTVIAWTITTMLSSKVLKHYLCNVDNQINAVSA